MGQLANVSAALIVPAGARASSEIALMVDRLKLLERLFEDVVIIGEQVPFGTCGRVIERAHTTAQSTLSDLASALEAAREQRVLVLRADLSRVTADLVLGLTAWPEHVCVVPRIDGALEPLCALYQKETALRAARREIEQEGASLARLLDEFECGILDGSDLAVLLS